MMAQTEVSVSRESRPIPKPADMAEYEAILPGTAERFITAWETETAHRRDLDRLQTETIALEIRAAAKDRRIGLWLSFLLGAGGLAALVYMAVHGVGFAGMAPVLIGFGALVWAVRRSTSLPNIEPPPGESDEEDKPGK